MLGTFARKGNNDTQMDNYDDCLDGSESATTDQELDDLLPRGFDAELYQYGLLNLVEDRLCSAETLDEMTYPIFVALMRVSEAMPGSVLTNEDRDRVYAAILQHELDLTQARLRAAAAANPFGQLRKAKGNN